MYVLRIIYSSLEHSLYGQGIDRMILEVDEKYAQVIRPVFHGLIIRLGRGLGAILVLVLAVFLGISFLHMALVYLIVLIIWMTPAHSLRPFLKKSSPLSSPPPSFNPPE